jgi:hypothetical protein
MAAQSVPFLNEHVRVRKRSAEAGRGTRHRLVVVAESPADLVCAAGGLIYDRASLGWDVAVFLSACKSDRALSILGVRWRTLASTTLSHMVDLQPDAIVASHDLFTNNRRVHRFIRATSQHRTEIALWGGARWPTELDEGLGQVEHRLSRAALAFKPYAIEAAGVPASCESNDVETFHSSKRRFEVAANFETRR